MTEETNQGDTRSGFCREVVETFFRTTRVFLLEDHPKIREIIGHLMRDDAVEAIFCIKATRWGGNPIARTWSFAHVERITYASICPHHGA